MSFNRRKFLKTAGQSGLVFTGLSAFPLWTNHSNHNIDLAVVQNGDPASLVNKSLKILGGIDRFVKKGNIVVVKPNIGWDRAPEQAATTNPEVVAEIVRLCLKAGAAKVKVFDRTCNNAKRCYHRSQIQTMAKKAGADVSHIYSRKFKKVTIPNGKILDSWEFYDDVLKADVFINVPIAKHHSLSELTLGMKNIMGIIGGNRGSIHNHFNEKIIDLNSVIKPHITILDAVRILKNNGPAGGNLNDVESLNVVAASVNPVLIDAYGATLFGLKPTDLEYLKEAESRGWGSLNLQDYRIKSVILNN